MDAWSGTIYHIYPLGALGAEHHHHNRDPVPADDPGNIRRLADWIPHLHELHISAVLLGPVFESESHGYDTLDMTRVDPRLGSNEDLIVLCDAFHAAGISVILDAVFNHVGRGHPFVQDVLTRREGSAYRSWLSGLTFTGPGPEDVHYDTWDGHGGLVKLNLQEPAVREHLLGAVDQWIREFQVDGLRLDAADVIDPSFWPELRARVDRNYHPEAPLSFGKGRFFLMGEMVHGDYASIVGPATLRSVTNFELYKGLYSSHNDGNYHEIAHSLRRQFAEGGIYRGIPLQTFADNHDVDRVAATLGDPRHLYPLHILLFTVPGIPSLYYGSEAGFCATTGNDDWPVRPALTPAQVVEKGSHPDLIPVLRRLTELRAELPGLSVGAYREVFVDSMQLAFVRAHDETELAVVVNAADTEAAVDIPLPGSGYDLLNRENIDFSTPVMVAPFWGRVIRLA